MTISMNRTTNSDGGDEFSYNNELSFYNNDELSNVGNEFYSPDENLAPLKIDPLLCVSFFSRHQIPPKDRKFKTFRMVSLPFSNRILFFENSPLSKVGDSYTYPFWSLLDGSTCWHELSYKLI